MFIVLIDDHSLLTESLSMILLQQPGVDKVMSYNSGDDFIVEKQLVPPDLIILDIMMPGIDGIKLIEHCRNEFSDDVKIIVLSFIVNVQIIKQAMRKGANGFISKSASIIELLNAIEEVKAGNQFISKKIRDEILKSMVTEEKISFQLTQREKDVLEGICKGLTIKEIAFGLKLKYHTVQYYHKNILVKLKVKRSSDLIVFAMLHGLYIPEIST